MGDLNESDEVGSGSGFLEEKPTGGDFPKWMVLGSKTWVVIDTENTSLLGPSKGIAKAKVSGDLRKISGKSMLVKYHDFGQGIDMFLFCVEVGWVIACQEILW